jgi:hypothetical protein
MLENLSQKIFRWRYKKLISQLLQLSQILFNDLSKTYNDYSKFDFTVQKFLNRSCDLTIQSEDFYHNINFMLEPTFFIQHEKKYERFVFWENITTRDSQNKEIKKAQEIFTFYYTQKDDKKEVSFELIFDPIKLTYIFEKLQEIEKKLNNEKSLPLINLIKLIETSFRNDFKCNIENDELIHVPENIHTLTQEEIRTVWLYLLTNNSSLFSNFCYFLYKSQPLLYANEKNNLINFQIELEKNTLPEKFMSELKSKIHNISELRSNINSQAQTLKELDNTISYHKLQKNMIVQNNNSKKKHKI